MTSTVTKPRDPVRQEQPGEDDVGNLNQQPTDYQVGEARFEHATAYQVFKQANPCERSTALVVNARGGCSGRDRCHVGDQAITSFRQCLYVLGSDRNGRPARGGSSADCVTQRDTWLPWPVPQTSSMSASRVTTPGWRQCKAILPSPLAADVPAPLHQSPVEIESTGRRADLSNKIPVREQHSRQRLRSACWLKHSTGYRLIWSLQP